MGANPFGTLYSVHNGPPSTWFNPIFDSISGELGGTQSLALRMGPSFAGQLYVTLGSLSGTSPGFTAQGVAIPINPDAYTLFTLTSTGAPLFSGHVVDPSAS